MDKGQEGTLYAFGSNGNGQLGIASDDDTSTPQPAQFSTNFNTTINNSFSSSLDNNSVKDSKTRPHVHAVTPFYDFAAGGNHTALITHGNRQLFMTGSNKDGETLLREPSQVFKLAEISERLQPQQQQQQHQLNKDQGQDQENSSANSAGGVQWRSVACGWAFTIGLTEPYPAPDCRDTIAISCDSNNNNNNQTVYAWGSGSFGELGLGPGRSKTGGQAIAITTGLLNTSPTSTTRYNTRYEFIKVRAGLRHVLLLAKETRISDEQGIAGEATARTVLMGWGSNRQGQLGVLTRSDGDLTIPLTEKELRAKFMEPTRIMISITARRDSMADTALGTENDHCKDSEILDMACGQNHSLVLFSNGAVYSSGLDKYGQLGPRATTSVENTKNEKGDMEKSKKVDFRIGFEQVAGLPFVDSISCGWNHNAAMDTRPLVGDPTAMTIIYLWGRNDHGQLGGGLHCRAVAIGLNGGMEDVPAGIVQVRISPVRRKGGCGEEEDSKSKEGLEFEQLVSYSCGSEHTLAMTRSGNCYAWGWNEHGNCGGGVDSSGNKELQDVPTPRIVQFPTQLNSSSGGHSGWVTGGYGSSWVWT
ncbi:hypothetical protein BGZ96_003464 [Linnemannia gamsii]|uniref:Uncharacterized protein n=1 Tax=Linnemannia gamsii TaxID=64522 RepID=A0ABQ7JJ98_9FUNG|nr:hypothetical protein BGZ96_003464 [Linnemannia gamsii]